MPKKLSFVPKNTNERVFESASDVFAKKGYPDVRIAEIFVNTGAS